MNNLIEKIKKQLTDRSETISVAESLTAGNIQSLLSSIDGSSDYFEGGITCYNIDQKVKFLKVNREHAASCDCVSQQVANEMASHVQEIFGSDWSVATTGYITSHFHYSIFYRGDKITGGLWDFTSNEKLKEFYLDMSRADRQKHLSEYVLESLYLAILSKKDE